MSLGQFSTRLLLATSEPAGEQAAAPHLVRPARHLFQPRSGDAKKLATTAGRQHPSIFRFSGVYEGRVATGVV
jgi:hypothetical protein